MLSVWETLGQFASAASLLLGVATCVLWARSYHAGEELVHQTDEDAGGYQPRFGVSGPRRSAGVAA